MNLTSYDRNDNFPLKKAESLLSPFSQHSTLSKHEFDVLKKFSEIALNDDILYPFDTLKHLNHIYLNFIKTQGQELAKALIFDKNNSQKIFDYLLNITRRFLAKNGSHESEDKIYQNWLLLISMSLPIISNLFPNQVQFINQQIDSLFTLKTKKMR